MIALHSQSQRDRILTLLVWYCVWRQKIITNTHNINEEMPKITFDNGCNNMLKYHNHFDYVVCYAIEIAQNVCTHVILLIFSIIWPAAFFLCVSLSVWTSLELYVQWMFSHQPLYWARAHIFLRINLCLRKGCKFSLIINTHAKWYINVCVCAIKLHLCCKSWVINWYLLFVMMRLKPEALRPTKVLCWYTFLLESIRRKMNERSLPESFVYMWNAHTHTLTLCILSQQKSVERMQFIRFDGGK